MPVLIKQLLLVALGGGVGSALRFLVSEIVHKYESGLPIATFLANVAGCFCIGLFMGLVPIENNNLRLLLMVGFCGGFTTFSAFSRETMELITNGQPFLALGYVSASCVLGICAVWIGMWLTK